ncbi:MAG: hypothetical protein RIS75_434 [Actinomycetota bacterium]|jgi:peptidyl-prolyl cis-trans isomerase B (cyclophilin B)
MSPSKRRERELSQAKRERQLQRATAKQDSNRVIIGAAAVIIILVGAFFIINKGQGQAGIDNPTATATEDNRQCGNYPAPIANPVQWEKSPKVDLNAKAYTWKLLLNCGEVEAKLFPDKAPITVNSMKFLSEQNFYDGVQCHRLTTSGLYVLQCGDPTGTGMGGPGYSIPEENKPEQVENNYPAGTLAMARSQAPGSGGSQFFIVYEDTTLGADYTIFGQITKGLDLIKEIAAAGVDGGATDGTPFIKTAILNAEVVAG